VAVRYLRADQGQPTTVTENKITKIAENAKFGDIKSVSGCNLCLYGSWRRLYGFFQHYV